MPNLNPVGQECWQAWLPVEQRITYNLCLFMHLIHNGQAPQYLSDCVSTVSAASHRYRLRSTGSAVYVLPRTRTRFGERGFFYSGPATWNKHSSFRPSRHYWYQYFQKTIPGCTFWSCLPLTVVGAPGRRPTNTVLIDWLKMYAAHIAYYWWLS